MPNAQQDVPFFSPWPLVHHIVCLENGVPNISRPIGSKCRILQQNYSKLDKPDCVVGHLELSPCVCVCGIYSCGNSRSTK